MKSYLIVLLLIFSVDLGAWDTTARTDLQRSSTNNVNLTNTLPVSDSYTNLGAYVQTKNEQLRFRLRGRLEKYSKQTENDNYSIDFSSQFKRTKSNDFSLNIFRQTFNGVPLVSTDTVSDNNGVRLSANIGHDFNTDSHGYILLSGTYKKYSKLANRSDKTLSATFGFEHYFNSDFQVSPELSIQKSNATDSYYTNGSVGPSLLFTFVPHEQIELFLSGNYTYTKYSDRQIAIVSRRRVNYEEEYQKLWNVDFGAEYYWSNNLSLQGKYSTSTNSSNNEFQEYKARILTIGLSLKI